MSMIDAIRKDREAGTPGGWSVDMSYQWPSKVRAAPPFDARWICDASVQPSADDQSHTLANARRIARVPDMEAALIKIQEYIEWDCDGLGAFIPAEALEPFRKATGAT